MPSPLLELPTRTLGADVVISGQVVRRGNRGAVDEHSVGIAVYVAVQQDEFANELEPSATELASFASSTFRWRTRFDNGSPPDDLRKHELHS